MCCSPWGCKESDTTERLNGTELKEYLQSAYLKKKKHLIAYVHFSKASSSILLVPNYFLIGWYSGMRLSVLSQELKH